jgi:hypothetical protein
MTYLHDHNDANIINLVKAMDYNAAGQPIIRTSSSQSVYNTGGNLDGRIDAFGRLRVSEPVTLFDSSFRYGDNEFNWSNYQTSGDAVLTHLPNESSMSLYLGTTADEEIIRETKRVFQYQPGKSLLVLNTFCMAAAKSNLRQRVGYFGTNNGIYFEQNGTGYNMVRRSYTGGAVDNTQVSQGAWNVDPLDGTGPSGVTADFSKTQIFWMDVEWLGVGSVRTGFVINGQFLICHIFHHANILDKVYMTTATLPIRYEIKNTGTTPTSSTMRQICSSVMSEGGYTPSNTTRSASSAIGGKNISDTVFTPLVAIRLRSGREDSIAVPITADLFGLQQAAFKWAIIKGANVVGGSWVPALDDSSVEYNVTATAQDSGTLLQEGVFVGATKGGAQGLDLRPYAYSMQLTRRLDSTRETLVLCALATTNNDDAVGTLTWQEDV